LCDLLGNGWFVIVTNNVKVNPSPSFLGAFAKLRKATISFVMSVRLSILVEQLGSHWTDVHEI
jgi:hypothetical protein